jgi:hypothetical protein
MIKTEKQGFIQLLKIGVQFVLITPVYAIFVLFLTINKLANLFGEPFSESKKRQFYSKTNF